MRYTSQETVLRLGCDLVFGLFGSGHHHHVPDVFLHAPVCYGECQLAHFQSALANSVRAVLLETRTQDSHQTDAGLLSVRGGRVHFGHQ